MFLKLFATAIASVIIAIAAQVPHGLANDYPSRTVSILVPFAPGGYTDLLARLIADKLTKKFGKPFIVENRPGAGTVVAASATARAAPDGYTLLMVPNGTIATNPTLYKSLPYDPLRDFVPLSLVASGPLVLLVNPDVPAKNVSELIELAKEKPGALNYGSPTGGANISIFMSMFQKLSDIKMTEIPYRGVVPMLTDALAGRIQVMFADLASSQGYISQGKLRALGISTSRRFKGAPEIPTIAESGLPDFNASAWQMMVAPKETPKEIVAVLNSSINDVVKSADVTDAIIKFGLIAEGEGTPEELVRFCQSEVSRWGDILRQAGLAGTQ
jgi:tripartite-type tricarboxylate transporter receptor subunit TctC